MGLLTFRGPISIGMGVLGRVRHLGAVSGSGLGVVIAEG